MPLPRPPRGALRFEDVRFHYPTRFDAPALAGLTLDVRPGETVAVVGPAGVFPAGGAAGGALSGAGGAGANGLCIIEWEG